MYDLSDLPQATKPGTKSLGKKFRNYGKHYIDKCEDCLITYFNPNFLSYFGVGYIAIMIILYSTIIPFVYFPTLFMKFSWLQCLLHTAIFCHLETCLVYNFYQMMFGRQDFFNPILLDEKKVARVHYCSVCKATVLKRDHHCFFYGLCVGYYNLKHFIAIPYWGAVSCAYSLIPLTLYFQLSYNFHPESFSSLFIDLMTQVSMAAIGYRPMGMVVHFFLAILCVFNIVVLPIVSIMFVFLAAFNQTSYEFSKGIKSFYKSVHKNFTESLGRRYWLLLFLPKTHSQIDYFSIPDHHMD